MVEALCYEPEGRGFEPDEVVTFVSIHLILTAAAPMFRQPLTEMSIRKSIWGKVRPARKVDN
jgi:hypothetical protein